MFSDLKYEVKESLTMRQMIAILLILAVALGFVQLGVAGYKNSLEQKPIFQDVEKNVIESYATYRHFATYGFRMLFLPAPISILFGESAILKDLMANIETGFRTNIYQSMKSSAPFGVTQYLLDNFSGIYLFFGGLLMLFYGYIPFLSTEYLRHLASIAGEKNYFFRFFVVRAIMATLFSLLFLFAAVLVITLNGIDISIDKYLVMLFLKMVVTAITFIFIGAVFGTIKSMAWGLGGAISSWISLLLIVPSLVGIIVTATSSSIKPENKLELEKLKLMMNFEKRSNEKAGILELNKEPANIDRELVESYYKNEFQKIQALEIEVKAQMQAHTDFYYMLSAIFPTTSYMALTQEVSSRGYKNLYAFYQTVIQIKEAFFKEYMKQVYFTTQTNQPAKVEPFLKGDDNIYVGKPALPGYLILGFIFDLLWILGFGVIAYYRFKKVLFALPDKKMNMKAPQDIMLKSGEIIEWEAKGDFLNRMLYSSLSNESRYFKKKGYDIKISLDGQILNTAGKRLDFLYLCHPKRIPGNIKVNDYLSQVMGYMKLEETKREQIKTRFSLDAIQNKKFECLEPDELGTVFLAVLEMKPFSVYLLDNIGDGMYCDFCLALKDKLDQLCQSGAAVLLIAKQFHYLDKKTMERGYFKSNQWLSLVEGARDAHKREDA